MNGILFYLPVMENAAPIPGYEKYAITRTDEVYLGKRQLSHIQNKHGRSARVKLRIDGKVIAIAVPKLVAMAYVPNPNNHTHFILIDRNKENYCADNIRWLCASDHIRFNQGCIDAGDLSDQLSTLDEEAEEANALPIPGYKNYRVTPDGKVYYGSRRLYATPGTGNRTPRIRVKDSEGKVARIAVAKLIALAFIPNPDNHHKIIFKDRDSSNCRVDNIQWVSTSEYIRFVNHHAANDNLLGPSRPKRKAEWIDPERVPLQGYPGYFITRAGVVYKKDRIIKPLFRKDKSLIVRIRWGGKEKFFGLAKLVATHFIPNPQNHQYIIFKDRDNHNCHAHNIAWVDAETFTFYCGIHEGAKKKVLPREEALRQCTNDYLRAYYETLDETWLEECWAKVEERITLPDWDACRSECYLYFIDRARRFTLIKDPVGLMIVYMRGVRAKIRKEISCNMPASVVRKTDESLRFLGSVDDY